MIPGMSETEDGSPINWWRVTAIAILFIPLVVWMDSQIDAPATVFMRALPVGFAAFCAWLGIRIVNRREEWAIWIAITIGVLAYIVGLCIAIDGRLPPSPWAD